MAVTLTVAELKDRLRQGNFIKDFQTKQRIVSVVVENGKIYGMDFSTSRRLLHSVELAESSLPVMVTLG